MSRLNRRKTAVSRPAPHGEWYPALDGVRGIAVFLVFTIHYVPRLIGYVGWSGVLIFFALRHGANYKQILQGVVMQNVVAPARLPLRQSS